MEAGARRKAKIGVRLETALKMLPTAETLADIGCDHGFLGAAALDSGIAKRIIASDISAPSLEKARRLAEKRGISDLFDFRVGDGLDCMRPGEAQCAVLLGMGGELIASILNKGSETAHTFDCIVMLPMRGEAELRQYLYESGYAIADESVVFEGGRYYQLISAKFCPEQAMPLPKGWPEQFYQFGAVALQKRERLMLPMMQRYLSVIEQKLERADKKGSVPAALIREADCTRIIIELYQMPRTADGGLNAAE